MHAAGTTRCGHEALDTKLAYTPVLQAYGHRYNSLSALFFFLVLDAQGVIECTRENPGKLKIPLCTASSQCIVFFLFLHQSNVQPHLGSGIMAMPQSVLVLHARLFEELKTTPRISGISTFNHQGMPLSHVSSRNAFHLECYLPTRSRSCLLLHSPLLCAAYSSFPINIPFPIMCCQTEFSDFLILLSLRHDFILFRFLAPSPTSFLALPHRASYLAL